MDVDDAMKTVQISSAENKLESSKSIDRAWVLVHQNSSFWTSNIYSTEMMLMQVEESVQMFPAGKCMEISDCMRRWIDTGFGMGSGNLYSVSWTEVVVKGSFPTWTCSVTE